MGNLIPLYKDKKPFVTADGSISFYNLSFLEAYHAKSIGAYTESLYKFIKPSKVIDKLQHRNVNLLDICFGLGYNLAVTINEILKTDIKNNLYVTSLEIDSNVVELVKNTYYLWPVEAYKILRNALKDGNCQHFFLDIIFGDATQTINNIKNKFDIIYFDPFSKKKTPELWTEDFFKKLYYLLKDDGILITYSCAKSVRKDFEKVGFKISDVAQLPEGFQKGTLCKK
jgi:chorismate dehydratase